MTKIDLRRGDFEGMHPKAKLFGFDEDKKLYTGDGVESINHQWTTWCACIGMLHLEVKEAQAVPEGLFWLRKSCLSRLLKKWLLIALISQYMKMILFGAKLQKNHIRIRSN
ncbi:hypothetical protein ACNFX6_06450 [Acinetobacter johnsonii]|uniref:hypothetical protein n=1 Tax=Acinetobacter johnsonii TaxID=40214 RepID=UPI003CF7BA18